MRVASTAEHDDTSRLRHAAVQTSGLLKAFSYQWVVKVPKGIVGKRSELNENTKLAAMGAKMKTNTSVV